MRADVKIGLVAALVTVVLAGWYFTGRGDGGSAIPIMDDRGRLALNDSERTPKSAPDARNEREGRSPSGQGQKGNDRASKRRATNKDAAQQARPRSARDSRRAGEKDANARQREAEPKADKSKPQSSSGKARAGKRSGRRRDAGENGPASPPAGRRTARAKPQDKDDAKANRPASLPAEAGDRTRADRRADRSASRPKASVRRSTSPANKAAGAADSQPDAPSVPRRGRMETHTVRPGDTLAAIARMYYGDVRYVSELSQANPQIVDATNIAVGTQVNIPDAELPARAGERADDRRKRAGSGADRGSAGRSEARGAHSANRSGREKRTGRETNAASVETRRYVVQAGDSLYGIARDELSQGSRWEEIYALNKAAIGVDPGRLKVGQVLKLPRK